ncbi:MAG TPA: PEP-CTERM sorting domain-containing protein [Fimbriimonadaceae bacterium]|nr:PEP-CTERM sorting domain-containing protein [Fimbriimonadaceae bacterium]
MVGIGAYGVVPAYAQYDLGNWNLTPVSETPGTNGGQTGWSTAGGQYALFQGVLNWTAAQGSNSGPLSTMCSSFYQDFDPSGPTFPTHAYWLSGSSAGATDIVLGDGITHVSLPSVDTDETGDTFLRAAALFGEFYPTASQNDNDATALGLAVWQTLYANQPGTPFAPWFSGSAPPQLVADEAAYYNAGLLLNSSNWAGLLTNVDWYNFTPNSDHKLGQGQFAYVPSPEPASVVLLIGGAAALLRRRARRV